MPFLKLIISLVLISGMLSCRSNYALFQETSVPKFNRPAKTFEGLELKTIATRNPDLEPVEISAEVEVKRVKTFFPVINIEKKKVIIPELTPVQIKATFVQKGDPQAKAKEKKKRQRQRFWRQFGSNLLLGTVFLVIAVLLALIHLQSLSILFGVASILFLFFGFRKIFKKKRRQIRNPFKRNL